MGLFVKRPPASQAVPGNVRTGNEPNGSYFGKTVVITGSVSGEDAVTLHGQLDGEIALKGRLTVGRQARVEGVVSADMITANGKISGDITAANTLHLEYSASISGRVSTAKLSVLEGAVLNGELKMGTQPRGGTDP